MATFALRRAPPLALVPRGSKAEEQSVAHAKSRQAASPGSRPAGRATTALPVHAEENPEDKPSALDGAGHLGDVDVDVQEEQRLGERFLRAMAVLARLSRASLDAPDGGDARTSRRKESARSPSTSRDNEGVNTVSAALRGVDDVSQDTEALSEELRSPSPGKAAALPPKTGAGGSPMRAHLVKANVATAPLQEHLTFEITMLLPPPIDSRQRALQSPIRRERLRKRRRRRRRKKRLRREWHTSLTTWVPHMASDYAESQEASAWRRNHEFQLSQQMQQLDLRRPRFPSVARSISLPLLGRWQVQADHEGAGVEQHSPDDESGSDSGEDEDDSGEDEDGGDNSDSGNASDANDSDASRAASPSDTQMPTASAREESDGIEAALEATPAAAPSPHHTVRHHRPAWISPELRVWLIDSGLFATTTTTRPRREHEERAAGETHS